MLEVLKPGGLLVVEDGDLTSAGSSPVSSLNGFAALFGRLGPTRGLDYTLANRLYHLVKPACHCPRGNRFLLKWSVDWSMPLS
jgi:hypothetical protein